MKYSQAIQSVSSDPEQLENLYQGSRKEGAEAEFRADVNDLYIQEPHNLLLGAWYHRFLQYPLAKVVRHIPWALAIVFGILSGLTLFAVSDPNFFVHHYLPGYAILWSPIATVFCLIFLVVVRKKDVWRFVIPILILVMSVGYVILSNSWQTRQPAKYYLDLMVIHLPLLCWACLGLALTGFRSSATNRFAFLTKSIEVAIAAGLFLIFGVILGGVTIILFTTINVKFPDLIFRLIGFGGFGLLPILAVATVYDPTLSPEAQDFSQGLSKFITILMRLLLPLSLVVLIVYILLIPFNFTSPFENRDVLITFNVVIFAIIGLLIGAIPLSIRDLSPRLQSTLRIGLTTLSGMAALVSIYALAAIIYRSSEGITMNRLTVMCWNTVNLSIFLSILYLQWRKGFKDWIKSLHLIISRATILYTILCILLIITIPLIYR